MAACTCRYADPPRPHSTGFIRSRRFSRRLPTVPDIRRDRADHGIRAGDRWLFRHSGNARLSLILGTFRWNAGRHGEMMGGVGGA
jgi:hypothetical protein